MYGAGKNDGQGYFALGRLSLIGGWYFMAQQTFLTFSLIRRQLKSIPFSFIPIIHRHLAKKESTCSAKLLSNCSTRNTAEGFLADASARKLSLVNRHKKIVKPAKGVFDPDLLTGARLCLRVLNFLRLLCSREDHHLKLSFLGNLKLSSRVGWCPRYTYSL